MGVWPLQPEDCYLKALVGALKRAPSDVVVLYLIDVRSHPPRLVPQGARGTFLPDPVELGDNVLGDSFLRQKVVASGHEQDAFGLCVPFKNGVLYLGRPAGAYTPEEIRAERRWVRQVHGAVRNAATYRKAVEEQTRDLETGVFNGVYMDLRMQEEYRRSERFGRDLSLVSIRTETNIRGVAAWLVDRALDTDLVAHLGNGHFAVLLIEAPSERVEHFVSQVRAHGGLEVKDVVSFDRSQR